MTLFVAVVILALIFDFINGFHDAANSIATIVSTKVLSPLTAVLWAAGFNFLAFWLFKLKVADTVSKTVQAELVMDFATLTGAAAAAVGTYGMVCMGTADENVKSEMKKSGETVYERLAEFPFWEEYDELLKSDIADMKNIGGPVAGAITAGKFLQRYIDYPWMHFDIAGPAFLHSPSSYRGKNGTGIGVRFLFEYFNNIK